MKVPYEEMFPWERAQAMARAAICYLPLPSCCVGEGSTH